jgi:hypothetical protein
LNGSDMGGRPLKVNEARPKDWPFDRGFPDQTSIKVNFNRV